MINSLIHLLIVFIILGIIWYGINYFVPGDAGFLKKALQGVLVLVGILYLIYFLVGLSGKSFNVGHGPAMDRVEEKQSSV